MCTGTPENTCCFSIIQILFGRKQIRRLQMTVSLSIPCQVNGAHPMCSSDWGSPNQKLIPQISDLDGMKLKFRNSYLSSMLVTVEAKVQERWSKELLLQVNHGKWLQEKQSDQQRKDTRQVEQIESKHVREQKSWKWLEERFHIGKYIGRRPTFGLCRPAWLLQGLQWCLGTLLWIVSKFHEGWILLSILCKR